MPPFPNICSNCTPAQGSTFNVNHYQDKCSNVGTNGHGHVPLLAAVETKGLITETECNLTK